MAASSGALNGDDEYMAEFMMVEPAQRENDEGIIYCCPSPFVDGLP